MLQWTYTHLKQLKVGFNKIPKSRIVRAALLGFEEVGDKLSLKTEESEDVQTYLLPFSCVLGSEGYWS